jgi:hypothetical protein
MLFIWLLSSAALTFWTGMKPPRQSAQAADRLNRPGGAQRRAVVQRVGSEPAEVASQGLATDAQTEVIEAPEALALSRGRRTEGRADPEAASLAANADS